MMYVNFKHVSYEVWNYMEDSNWLHDSIRKDHPVTFL
jgi:hypothetical protein